ncbi:nucleotide exchange factor GrpE [Candidatus Babeliales bacterium]|nr:nucleotide exchange factor GrpE [Candidatus Babeliales bacterium]
MTNNMENQENFEKKHEEIHEDNIEEINNNLNEFKKCQDQLIRISADFDNYKKRTEKEKKNWIEFAQSEILEKFLPFINDLARAIETCQKEQSVENKLFPWLEGFELIQKNLNKTMSDLGVKEMDCSGEFDPEFHEAVIQVDSDKHKTGEIVEVFVKGYMFKDRVLKHAKVSVAK